MHSSSTCSRDRTASASSFGAYRAAQRKSNNRQATALSIASAMSSARKAFELKALILTAGLDGFEEFLDEPTLAVGINHRCDLRFGIDRLGCN